MNDEVHVNEVDFDVDWIQTQGRWFNFSFCHNFQALVINIFNQSFVSSGVACPGYYLCNFKLEELW